jgi:hypothetical protein
VTHRPQEPAPRQGPGRHAVALLRLALAAALGAGGGAAERRLAPSPAETVEHANHEVEVQLRLQRLEDRASVLERDRDRSERRLDELEHQVRPASYQGR